MGVEVTVEVLGARLRQLQPAESLLAAKTDKAGMSWRFSRASSCSRAARVGRLVGRTRPGIKRVMKPGRLTVGMLTQAPVMTVSTVVVVTLFVLVSFLADEEEIVCYSLTAWTWDLYFGRGSCQAQIGVTEGRASSSEVVDYTKGGIVGTTDSLALLELVAVRLRNWAGGNSGQGPGKHRDEAHDFWIAELLWKSGVVQWVLCGVDAGCTRLCTRPERCFKYSFR